MTAAHWDSPMLVPTAVGRPSSTTRSGSARTPPAARPRLLDALQGQPAVGYVESPIVAATSSTTARRWSSWVNVSGPYRYNQGSVPVVAMTAAVYVSFEGAVAAYDYLDYNIVAKSTDGGKTFTPDRRQPQRRRELPDLRRPRCADRTALPHQHVPGAHRRPCHRQAVPGLGRQPQWRPDHVLRPCLRRLGLLTDERPGLHPVLGWTA